MLCDKCQGLAQPEPDSPLQHVEVAGYKLLHELGAGRFSHSWLAEDPQGRPMVLKLLRRYAQSPDSVRRFLDEAERLSLCAELAHPHIARPITAGVHLVEAFFLVYESGGELTAADELRQRGRLPASRALELCAQICEGLSALHSLGILHLDLKPANIGLTRLADGAEQAVVLDCATSHLLAHIALRDTGVLPLSTAAYMSPEEAAGRASDPRSDLYSVGVLLFQLLSGRLPINGATSEDLLRAHRDSAPLRLREAGRRVHDDLENLIGHVLAKDPSERPGSGEEMAVLLRAVASIAETVPEGAANEPEPLPPPPQPELLGEPPQMLPAEVDPALELAMMGELPRRRFQLPRFWPIAAGALAAAAVAGAFLIRPRKPPPAPPPIPVLQAAVLPEPPPTPEPPPPAAAAPAPSAAVEEPSIAPPHRPPAPSPYAKHFERAQKALWTNRAGGARTILRDLLKHPLTRRERARASKMMGEAEAKSGRKASAAVWYHKAFRLYDDPEERAKVAALLQKR